MNVIIANKYKEMLMNLDIEVIKSIEGEFEVSEIVDQFTNFYFDRMILDITAIKNYQNLDNLQKLSINFDMNKVILLLDNSEESNTKNYLSKKIIFSICFVSINLFICILFFISSSVFPCMVKIPFTPAEIASPYSFYIFF